MCDEPGVIKASVCGEPGVIEAGVCGELGVIEAGVCGEPRVVEAGVRRQHLRQRVEATGNETLGSTPEEFDAKFRADVARFKKIVQDAGLPMQD